MDKLGNVHHIDYYVRDSKGVHWFGEAKNTVNSFFNPLI
jgi:hypothetical protein